MVPNQKFSTDGVLKANLISKAAHYYYSNRHYWRVFVFNFFLIPDRVGRNLIWESGHFLAVFRFRQRLAEKGSSSLELLPPSHSLCWKRLSRLAGPKKDEIDWAHSVRLNLKIYPPSDCLLDLDWLPICAQQVSAPVLWTSWKGWVRTASIAPSTSTHYEFELISFPKCHGRNRPLCYLPYAPKTQSGEVQWLFLQIWGNIGPILAIWIRKNCAQMIAA